MSKPYIPRGAFQTAGSKFIIDHERCQLQVDCGLGKTVMTLDAIDTLLLCGFKGKILVLAPKRVAMSVWGDECKRWDHLSYLRVSPVIGTPKQRLAALKKDAEIYTVNFENLVWLAETIGDNWPFRMVVADESTRLKSHRAHFTTKKDGTLSLHCTGGKRARAIARLAFTKTKRWVGLSGTMTPNSLTDLYGQVWFIDKGASLGRSYSAFTDRWFKKGYDGFTLEMLPHSEKEIRDAIAPFTFTLRAKDYLDLGEEIVNNIYVDLPLAARKLYNAMEKELYMEIKAGAVEVFSAASKSNKCHQIANGAVYYDKEGRWEALHDAKIEALESVIEEAAGMPIIVVYQFKSDLIRLQKAFPQGKILDSGSEILYSFKKSEIPILFIHPQSAGHGIDGLQEATNIICFFSVDWNSEYRDQVIARIGAVRQFQAGFKRPVMIHNILARDTVDEAIMDKLETKKSVEEALKAGLARRNLK